MFDFQKLALICRKNGFAPSNLGDHLGITLNKSSVSKWRKGTTAPRADTLKIIADYFGVPVEYFDSDYEENTAQATDTHAVTSNDNNITSNNNNATPVAVPTAPAATGLNFATSIAFVLKPRYGDIRCGDSTTCAADYIECYDPVPASAECDYTLRCIGDSMMGDNICDGDIVFLKTESEIHNGQIYAIALEDGTTLKHLYFDGNALTIIASNPAYPPKCISGTELSNIRILGRMTGLIRMPSIA